MTTQLNGSEFVQLENRVFAPAFEGAQAKREVRPALLARRAARQTRRENRAL